MSAFEWIDDLIDDIGDAFDETKEFFVDLIDDIGDAFDEAKDFFIELMEEVWDKITHFSQKVFYTFKAIVSFFRDPIRLKKLASNKKLIALSVKEKLISNQYHIVNALYNSETDSLVDYDISAERIEADSIDSEMERFFGDKAMIVLR